ncbi:MAG: hypothetical protein ACKVW3_04975 [Phycisphaerales bacterium]
MLRRVLAGSAVLLTIVILASVRYGMFLQIGPAHSMGIAAGALVLVERMMPIGTAATAGTPINPATSVIGLTKRPPPQQRKTIDFYRHGFAFQWAIESRTNNSYNPPVRTFEFPLTWLLPFFALPAVFVVNRRITRRRDGRCVNCGYELAGATRCAECGLSAPKSSAAAPA